MNEHEMPNRPSDPDEMADVILGDLANLAARKDRRKYASAVEGWPEIPEGMINYDHSIDDGFEEKLRAGKCFGRHAGWNFNGRVWFAGGVFREEVWVFGAPKEVIEAPTLRELMDKVNEKYGAD